MEDADDIFTAFFSDYFGRSFNHIKPVICGSRHSNNEMFQFDDHNVANIQKDQLLIKSCNAIDILHIGHTEASNVPIPAIVLEKFLYNLNEDQATGLSNL